MTNLNNAIEVCHSNSIEINENSSDNIAANKYADDVKCYIYRHMKSMKNNLEPKFEDVKYVILLTNIAYNEKYDANENLLS